MTQNKLTAWWSEKSKALYRKLSAKIVSAETSVNIVYRKPSSHVGISHFFEKRFDMQRSSPTMKSYGVLLPLLKVLTGCLATPIKPSPYKIAEIRTILVVPVASPPLGVIPDLIETRFPVYHHYQAMPFYPYLVEKIYNNPGGVLIAGLVSKDGNVPVAELLQTSPSMEKFASLEPTTSLPEYWTPTFLLAKEAILQLNGDGFKAILSKHYYHLPIPIAIGYRNANLGNWHNAIGQWYNQSMSSIDYQQSGQEHVDAVLEVGIKRKAFLAGASMKNIYADTFNVSQSS